MAYCKYCGAELPEIANFCTKCGAQNPIDKDVPNDTLGVEQQPTQPTQPVSEPQQNSIQPSDGSPATPKKPIINATWFKENFMAIYVILGVVSVVLLQFSTMTAFSTFGFGVFIGILSILCAVAFCIVGTYKFFVTDNTATLGKKHTTGDVICFALGIIGFVYVLVTSIIVLKAASDLIEAMELLSQMGSLM